MLATIKVVAKDYHGNSVILRALCDSGCQINLITTDAVQTLRLRKTPSQLKILGLGGIQAAKGKAEMLIKSTIDANECLNLFVTPKLLGQLPQAPVETANWPDIRRLQLADKTFSVPGKIDMILGAEFYSKIVRNGIKHFKDGPTAQNTSFGWIIFGQVNIPICHIAISAAAEADDSDLSQALTRYWAMEDTPTRHYRSSEEQLCEDIFTNTIKRDQTGRFIATIPMQPNASSVIGSRQLALGRLRQMHRRFDKFPELRIKYVEFMKEYESLGHMSLVHSRERSNPNAVYIPHHAADTAKFRVVFDGSCKNKGSPSPNDNQLNGERLHVIYHYLSHNSAMGKLLFALTLPKCIGKFSYHLSNETHSEFYGVLHPTNQSVNIV